MTVVILPSASFDLSRFAYSIYYSIENESIFVRAVVDGRRDPRWIAEKLKGI